MKLYMVACDRMDGPVYVKDYTGHVFVTQYKFLADDKCFMANRQTAEVYKVITFIREDE